MYLFLKFVFSMCFRQLLNQIYKNFVRWEDRKHGCSSRAAAPTPDTRQHTDSLFFFPLFPNLHQFGSILGKSRWFGPIRANSGRFAPIQRRFRPSRADYSQNWPRNWPKYMLKKGPIPNHLYLQSEVHMGACQKANVSNIELSQKKTSFESNV